MQQAECLCLLFMLAGIFMNLRLYGSFSWDLCVMYVELNLYQRERADKLLQKQQQLNDFKK